MSTTRRVCLYSPANLNVVDGSSIWVESVARTLLEGSDVEVTIPLRSPERRGLITDELRRLGRVRLVDPRRQRRLVPPSGLFAAEVLDLIERLDREQRFDVLLLRSFSHCRLAVARGRFRGRLWSAYILEPERWPGDASHLEELGRIAGASEYVVVQSEEMRALFEACVPEGRGKTILLPPAVAPDAIAVPQPGPPSPRLFYAGKFHPFYPVPRMIDFLTELRVEVPDLELHVIGDKVYRPADDRAYGDRLEQALTTTPGVIWHGAMPRQQVVELMAGGGVALSLWDYAHGSSTNDLVVSTKLLDYCAAGLPVVLNRTAAQEALLGRDYPLFVQQLDEALPLLRAALSDEALYRAAAARCSEAARRFTFARVYEGLAPYLEGRPERAMHLYHRAKLTGAEYNVGVVESDGRVPQPAAALLGQLAAKEGRWRLVAGRVGAPGEPGADPEAAVLADLPAELRARATARTVDDPWNWWRTLGFVLLARGALTTAVGPALASGAVPVVIGRPPADPRLAPFAHPDAASAANAMAGLVERGAWADASRLASSLADSAITAGDAEL